MIKSIQRGTTVSSSVVLTSVNTQQTVITFLGQKCTSTGATCEGPPYPTLVSATSLTFTGGSGSSVTRGYQALERYR